MKSTGKLRDAIQKELESTEKVEARMGKKAKTSFFRTKAKSKR